MTDEPALNADAGQLRRKDKRKKVRTAWIAFIGRIVAHVVGAIASVTLGFMVLTKYGLPDRTPSQAPVASPAAAVDPVAPQKARRAGGLALAVLPVQNYSKDAAHAYFADGVTEALTAEITQIRGLDVTSRTSAMAYKGSTKALPAIARELDVDLILEGSVVSDRNHVRMTAQLIDANSDHHVWARSYDRPLRNVLPVQLELARTIAREITAALQPRMESRVSPEAVVKAQSGR